MPRYYFALGDGDLSLAEDEVGEELDHVEAARGHAMAVARELSRHQPVDALIGLYISVLDEDGIVVFKVAGRVVRPILKHPMVRPSALRAQLRRNGSARSGVRF
jgi:hypothetical protein